MDDLLTELENMALNAVVDHEFDHDTNSPTPIADHTIRRWRNLFHLSSSSEARELITSHRANISRTRVSDEHWSLVQSQKEAEGDDREAYEYEVNFLSGAARPQQRSEPVNGSSTSVVGNHTSDSVAYIIKLEPPLSTPAAVAVAASLSTIPPILPALSTSPSEEDDDNDSEATTAPATFCRIDSTAKSALTTWLATHQPSFRPTIVRLSGKAKKDLSEVSIYPTLGRDATMPQFRLDDMRSGEGVGVRQKQYPAWYFFYGTLADKRVLRRLLSLSEEEEEGLVLRPARVEGGRIEMWGGQYRALVDDWDGGGVGGRGYVEGWAYEVRSKEHEEALLSYETEKYEVVRCEIRIRDADRLGKEEELVNGLTFRFAGPT